MSQPSPFGTWYLTTSMVNAGAPGPPNRSRLTLLIEHGPHLVAYAGGMIDEDDVSAQNFVDEISWHVGGADVGTLSFRRTVVIASGTYYQWYAGTVVEGVFTGRIADGTGSTTPPEDPTKYRNHVTGWQAEYFDVDENGVSILAPRVFVGMKHDRSQLCSLRLDQNPDAGGSFVGIFRDLSQTFLEQRASIDEWDGGNLTFLVTSSDGAIWNVYTASQDIRSAPLSGIRAGFASIRSRIFRGQHYRYVNEQIDIEGEPWTFERTQALTYGLARSPQDRPAWQRRTRRQLFHLLMADNPTSGPTQFNFGAVHDPIPAPFPPSPSTTAGEFILAHRDDGITAPTGPGEVFGELFAYSLREFSLTYEVTSPYPPGLERTTHGFIAIPAGPVPPGGFPLVIAFNGHGGSAWRTFDATTDGLDDPQKYWYGDAFARHGYAVLSVDIGHRGPRTYTYEDYPNPDDPTNGNGYHPPIVAPGFADSDWEEDGERVSDVMQALTLVLYAASRPDQFKWMPAINQDCILTAGLSMGGHLANYVAALDERVTGAIPAGFNIDFFDFRFYGDYHGCLGWAYGFPSDYIDLSDLHALIAPRLLVMQTGTDYFGVDPRRSPLAQWAYGTTSECCSPGPHAFIIGKQVARRTRVAYADHPDSFTHYLHYDTHFFHFGAEDPILETLDPEAYSSPNDARRHVLVPTVVAPPTNSDDPSWQSDLGLSAAWPDLFTLLSARCLNAHSGTRIVAAHPTVSRSYASYRPWNPDGFSWAFRAAVDQMRMARDQLASYAAAAALEPSRLAVVPPPIPEPGVPRTLPHPKWPAVAPLPLVVPQSAIPTAPPPTNVPSVPASTPPHPAYVMVADGDVAAVVPATSRTERARPTAGGTIVFAPRESDDRLNAANAIGVRLYPGADRER